MLLLRCARKHRLQSQAGHSTIKAASARKPRESFPEDSTVCTLRFLGYEREARVIVNEVASSAPTVDTSTSSSRVRAVYTVCFSSLCPSTTSWQSHCCEFPGLVPKTNQRRRLYDEEMHLDTSEGTQTKHSLQAETTEAERAQLRKKMLK
jgi:hypothetical protein